MSFYILKNNHLTEIPFDYLKFPSGIRLEKTQSGHQDSEASKKKLKNLLNIFAIEIMSSPVITLDYQATVQEALQIFEKRNCHHLILVKEKQIRGLVSDRDISWLKKIEAQKSRMVSHYMSDMVLVCHEETPIDHLAKVLVKEKISALPVINGDFEVTGIVTHHDLLKKIYS